MHEYWVNAEVGVLELDLPQKLDDILIHNDPYNPCDLIYLILKPAKKDLLHWKSKTTLSGPKASLILLINSDVEIYNSDFSTFDKVLVSDNKYHRDGKNFLVVEKDSYKGNIVTFKSCQANSAYFLCKALNWFQGQIKNDLYVELHGQDTSLDLQGVPGKKLTIGNMLLSETIKPDNINLKHLSVKNNLICYANNSLSVDNVSSGEGNTLFQADVIERLSDFSGAGRELIIKATMATLSNFIMPIGKIYIDVNSFLDFKADGKGAFQGVDLYIDVTKNIDEKAIKLPYKPARFDKIFIKGANILQIPGSLVAESIELTDCLKVRLGNSSIGHLKYDVSLPKYGSLNFDASSNGIAAIGSLWSIGYNQIDFYGSAEVFDFDSAGRCNVSIYSNFKCEILKLNLDIDPQTMPLVSNVDGFWGLSVYNDGNKEVKINTILAKSNNFKIKGAVTFGKVICQPIDKYYNLLEVDANHIGRTSIGSFFAGFDHEIVIDKNTGRISLVQSMSRALEGSQIIAGLNCKLNDYLIIRAGSGLSFQGGIEVIEGDIDLFTLFGRLSARGSLTAKNKIQLVALEGEIDLTAELNAKSIVTYAKTGQYIDDSIINADLFLAEVVGNYVQLNSEMSANKIKIVSRNSDVMLLASQLYTNDLEVEANKRLRLQDNDLQANSALFSGKEILVDRDNILGNSLFRGSDRISLVGNNLEGDRIAYHAQDIDIIQSNLRALEIETESRNTQIIGSRLIGSQKHKTDKELLIERSEIMGELIQNSSRDTLKIDSSVIVGSMLLQGAKNNLEVKDSRLSGNYITNISGGNMKIDSSRVLADQALYFKAVSQYLAVNSDLSLVQYPYQLFTDNFGAIDSLGNPVIRCGIANQGNEILGLVNFGSYGSDELATLQYNVIDSSNIPLEVFNEISRESPKGVFIDAHSGVIMGSSLNATEHRVMIKTVKGIELLPLGVYNAAMFGGGINSSGINYAITKIEAGLISLEGGEIVKLVGALLKSNDGYIKADYLINESNIGEVIARQEVFSKLKPWLNNPHTYDLIINKQVVPSKLEFSEITKIDLGKGKIDILYPYSSKKVLLTQREGDVLLDRDLDVSNYEVMAINAEQGSILFGLPKLEEQVIPRIFKLFGVNTPNKIIETHSTHNNINIKAQTLVLDAGGDVDIHGSFTGSNLDVKAKGKFKISSDTHNFGKTLKQSVVRSDNLYVVADDIEMNGVLFTIKNHLKLVSDNNIRVLPIELLSHYHECSGKTTVKEDALLQVVSRINAGTLNIDAGKVAEFISTLIEVENLDIKAEDLKISAAKEIFTRQVEFQGAKKWYGGKGAYSMSFDHYETVQPTVINVKNLRIIVDNQATIEAAQIFAEEEILFKTGKGIIIKDGYNIHLHDYHAKQYSLLSFNQGSMKINSNKTFKDFFNKHESVPTIIVAGGHFYGITEGQMHILGSKIIGKDIHIVAPKGLKLEASKYIDTAVNFIHESGFKLGYYNKGNSEVGLSASGFVTSDKLELERHHVNESMLLARDSLSLIVKDGTFEQISSRMQGKIIRVEALNWEAKTYDNKVISNHISQEMETGIKLCAKQNVTQVFDKIKSLVSKKGSHVIDNADRLFKAYDTYKSLAMLPENATSSGLYAYLDGKEVSEYRSSSIAVDNIINGEDIIAKIENDIRFKGVKMTTENIDIEARDFEWQTSDDKHEYQYNLGSVGLEIDLLKKGLGSNLQSSNRNIESETIIHHQNYLKATGNLKLTLSGTGRFIGCSLEGANVDIKANNLILGSVQDIISEKLSGANFHIGYSSDSASNQFGGGFESGFKKSGWSQQLGKIIGSNLVNIVVKDSLELAGGIIANAEEDKYGNLSDKGNLSINCGRMIVKTIHDYDEGVTLGIGASFQLNNTEKGNVASFSHMPLKVEYKDNQRQLFGTIGSGNIISGVIEGDPLNRDISQTEQITKEESFAFDSVIHKEIFGNSKQEPEQVPFKKLYRSLVQEDSVKQKLGNYITDVVGNVKDSGKSFVLGGAKLVNMFGGKIDQERLDEKLHEIIGKDPHTGIDIKERERHLVKIQQEIDKLAETENLDYHKDQDKEHAYNKIAYTELFNQLDQQIDKIEDKKTQSLLRATHHILNNEYLKELKAARQENRAIKDIDQFVKEVLTVQLCKPQFANAKEIVWHSLESAKIMLDALVDLTMQGYSGVSAGENYTGSNLKPHDEHEESDESSDDEGWNLTNLAWYDEDGQLLPIDKRPQKPIKQNKVKSFKPITDISPDYTGLSNLLSKFELDEDHEISIMLKAMRKNQSMPIYDSSNKSGANSNNIGGFSFIDSANASGIGGINTVTSSVITVQDMLLGLGMRGVMSTGVGPLTTMAMNIARLTPTATLAGGIAVGLNNAAQFEHRHPWVGSDFDDIMSNPLVSQEHKDSMWKQMQNDPLLSSNKHKSFMMDIDLNANKPSVESFPIHHQPKSILFTPDDRDKLIQWNQLPGFMPSDFNTKDLLEGFDVHENHWKDSILYKDYEIDHWNVKLASVKDAPEVYQHGKFGKIYKDFEQKVGNKEIWWSKDTANHGGASEGLTPSTYKLFVVRKGEFEWIGDADATGKVIEGKHKSETGKDIKIKDCWKVK